MALMIPSDFDPAWTPGSERDVFIQLKNHLSDDWKVFHSLSYVVRDEGKRFDGEVDFILCHPSWGILLLEVKGGVIAFKDGQWYQNGNEIKNPVKQVQRNKRHLEHLLSEKLLRTPNLKIAHAVCFPQATYHDWWPLEAQDIVLCGDGLTAVEEFAKKMLAETPLPHGVTEDYPFREIIQILTPEFECGVRIADRARVEKEQFFRLTEHQCQLLEMLEYFPRLAIQGVAGSGKTVMAVKKAKRLAAAGKTVLLLCYNQVLAENLQHAVEEVPNIRAAALFDYAAELLKFSAEKLEECQKDSAFYTEILPEKLKDYLKCNNLRYDAVIVDEGQDFSKSAWEAISLFPQNNGCYYVFFDPEQNIFHKELNIPDFGLPLVMLTKNCRNTRSIINALRPYHHSRAEALPETPEGVEVREFHGNCRERLAEELERLLKVEKLPLSDIAVLGAHSMEHTCIGRRAVVGRFTMVKNRAAAACSKEVSYYTFMKFKGCEAKVVILLDVDIAEPRWQNPRSFYVAMSRAVHQLIILHRY